MEISRKIFSTHLNLALAERELTQKQAAQLCNISVGSFWRYLHGYIPSTYALYSIAQNLNISIDWLLGLSN